MLALISVLHSQRKREEIFDLYNDINLAGLLVPPAMELFSSEQRLNMELDLQNLFGLLCTAVLIG